MPFGPEPTKKYIRTLNTENIKGLLMQVVKSSNLTFPVDSAMYQANMYTKFSVLNHNSEFLCKNPLTATTFICTHITHLIYSMDFF